MRRTRGSNFSLISFLLVSSVFFVLSASAQKGASEKFKRAVERSEDSARLLSLLFDIRAGLPKELVDKAEIVAIFPHAKRGNVLVRKFLQGHGVISARQGNSWSLPAFYQFASAPRKFSGASKDTFAVILLFVKKDAVSWFGKDKSNFKKDRAAILGPTGDITEEQRKQLADVQIVVYTYGNSKLNAKEVDPDFFQDFILDEGNDINLPLYGGKGHEVLRGKQAASLPPGVTAFQEALQKYSPAH